MSIREEIKVLLARKNMTMTELAKRFSEKENKSLSVHSLSRKLARGTLSFQEAEIIADILGYDLIFKER